MKYILILLVVILLIYVIFSKRKLDFFTVSSFSVVVYYYPIIIGEIHTKNGIYNISFATYTCIFIYTLCLLYFLIIYDRIKISTQNLYNFKIINMANTELINNYSIIVVELIGLLLLVYTVGRYGDIRNGFNKMQLLANANRATEYMKYIALFTFVSSFISKGKKIFIARTLAVILLVYTFIIGHRSFTVIGCIAVFVSKIESDGKVVFFNYIKKHKVAIICISILAIVILFIKGVFAALITGQYDLVKSRLGNPEYYKSTLLSSEANVIINNLQRVCDSNMSYSLIQYIVGIVCLVPVLGGRIANIFEYTSFERLLNIRFNSKLSEGVGLGSTYLGEAYAVGGYFFVIIQTFFTVIFMSWMMKMRRTYKSIESNAFFLIVLSYFSFYIHRNSLIFLLITARAYLYIFILYKIIKFIVSRVIKKNTLIKLKG